VGGSSNDPLMSNDSSLLWALVSNHVRATCLTVATDEACPSLLGHHNSDGTTAVNCLLIATEGYEPSVQRCIIVVTQS
jgi:hypothetical protein